MSLFGSFGALGGVLQGGMGAIPKPPTAKKWPKIANAGMGNNQALWDDWGGDELVKKQFSPENLMSQFAGPAEFDPAILGGIGSAVGIGAGLIGSAISAKKASDSAVLNQSPGEWHARRTDPMLHEIDRQAFAPVNAARRGAVMEGGRALAANIAGGSGWLGERAGESLSGSFGRAAGHAQQQAALRKTKKREETEEERMRRVAAQQAKPAQFGKAASGMVGLIPGPVGKIGQLATGLGSKLFSSAIT